MLSNVSKMPGKSISRSAFKCKTGSKLAKVPGSVCFDCYARKGMYRMPNVVNKMEEREDFFHAIDFVPRMVALLNRTRSEFFRWFDSGDMYHIKLAHKMLEVMQRTPWVKHWLPTRMHKFDKFASVISDMQALPNVVVRLSSDSIRGDIIAGETTSTIVPTPDHATVDMTVCEAYNRAGKCGTCRACWDKSAQVIAYPAHGRTMIKLVELAA